MGPLLGRAILSAATTALQREAKARITLAFRRRAYLKMLETAGRKARQLDQGMRDAEQQSARTALEVAHELSSGRFSAAQLARMGHPYRIGGTPPQDAAIINRQSGEFYRGWRVIGPRRAGSSLTTKLINESPNAQRLQRGTSRMIARPILVRIGQRVEGQRRALYRATLRRTLSR